MSKEPFMTVADKGVGIGLAQIDFDLTNCVGSIDQAENVALTEKSA